MVVTLGGIAPEVNVVPWLASGMREDVWERSAGLGEDPSHLLVHARHRYQQTIPEVQL